MCDFVSVSKVALIVLCIMILLKVFDKLYNSSICGSHFNLHDLLVGIELYLIISCMSYFLVDDSQEYEYGSVKFTYFDLFSRCILTSL